MATMFSASGANARAEQATPGLYTDIVPRESRDPQAEVDARATVPGWGWRAPIDRWENEGGHVYDGG